MDACWWCCSIKIGELKRMTLIIVITHHSSLFLKAYTIFANTAHPKYRLILGLFAIFMHLSFLLYLHFAYHELAEGKNFKMINEKFI